jgi:hypothetical protein
MECTFPGVIQVKYLKVNLSAGDFASDYIHVLEGFEFERHNFAHFALLAKFPPVLEFWEANAPVTICIHLFHALSCV